jgi:uncharacterized YigZ family protein
MDGYPIPASEHRIETKVSNSRFIASISPAFTVDQARDFIMSTSDDFKDATHNVPVYIIGHGSSKITHANDDGEPSGTAGRPALAVLEGSGLGDTALVITRYFGGTKLGTGGLVKAYSDAARKVISLVPKALKVQVHKIKLEIPYPLFENISRIIKSSGGTIITQDFTELVTLIATIPANNYLGFEKIISETSGGKIHPLVLARNQSAKINQNIPTGHETP